jgi:hypothetical protein
LDCFGKENKEVNGNKEMEGWFCYNVDLKGVSAGAGAGSTMNIAEAMSRYSSATATEVSQYHNMQ